MLAQSRSSQLHLASNLVLPETDLDLNYASSGPATDRCRVCLGYVHFLPLGRGFLRLAVLIDDDPGYITYFMSLLKIDNYFTVAVVLYIVMLLSNLAAFPLIETAGRRILLVPGIIALTVILLVSIHDETQKDQKLIDATPTRSWESWVALAPALLSG